MYKKSYLFTVFYLILFAGFSQPQKKAEDEGQRPVSGESSYVIYLDSAKFYKKSNIAKSIDFIAQAIGSLGENPDKKELALTLTYLGEVYQYHKQFDLAISSFKDAQGIYKTSRTALLLGRAYIQTGDYKNALDVLKPLEDVTVLVPYQKITLYESLGDVYSRLNEIDMAIAYYEEGLIVAKKNQVSPKIPDLNSKIADAYAQDNRLEEAEGYYDNSLQLSSRQAPQRSIQEKEKVADFYNKKNQYDDEIELRKKSLNELQALPRGVAISVEAPNESDSITSQRINYKIANAYVAQDKYDEAIPYLEESIKEADFEDDLMVQKDATRKLSEVYRDKGDFTKAFETYQKYVAIVDTLYLRKELEISQASRLSREIATGQSRIAGLEKERELSQSKYDLAITEQQLALESNKKQKWIIYSLLLAMLLTALAAYFFYRSNKQQRLANNLLALKSLRSQMNPHFIFNALNSVNNYIAKNDERSANRYLSEFSTLMRAVLENSEEDFISLSREMELLELYVKLEHSRFPEKFDYTINLDENIDTEAFQIPPMLLQPYIENAIWHGLRYKKEKGSLNIDLKQKGPDVIEIIIADNGIGRKKSQQLKTSNQKNQSSKGMGNIKKRIAILNTMYKDKVSVVLKDLNEDGTGTVVNLTLRKRA
ncbi:tetratricopeptide repeat protein [uncultured Eudoraea sp.]|uniref:tetratricopeptide repeat protein n=1 Tax=uncultured Eudoraea sp. TaxID=1035614 RepID=UPI002623FBB8|nr:tetratricopeptide repeat protein [uncultured Eudoraea sp.]